MASPIPRILAGLALALCVVIADPGLVAARDATPLILTDSQMDAVTAGVAMNIDLAAAAAGPTAVTSTAGQVQLGTADVLSVTGSPKSGMHLVSDSLADVAWGGGLASATGSSGATCTAKTTIVGDVAYSNQIGAVTATPTSAICTCAALAISFIPH